MRHSLWGGLSLGTVTGLFVVAVRFTTIANVTIINGLQIVVVSVVSWLVFGERMSRRDILYAALAMAGVAVVALGSSGSENWSLGGDLAAVGGLFAWCFYFYATRRAQMKASTQEYTACVAIYVGLISLPLAALVGQDLSWPSGEDWMWLAALAFGLGILGHNAMNWSLQHVPLWLVSTLSLFTPVVASALAWLVFDEALSTRCWMLAMAMIVRNQSRPRIGAVPAGIGSALARWKNHISRTFPPEGCALMTANRRRLAVALVALAILAFSCSGDSPSTAAPPSDISPSSEPPPAPEPPAPEPPAPEPSPPEPPVPPEPPEPPHRSRLCRSQFRPSRLCRSHLRPSRPSRPPGAACAGASSARAARAARARAAAARPGAGSIRVPERLVRGLFLLGSCQL